MVDEDKEICMAEICRQFKVVGHHGMSLIADYQQMLKKPPKRLASMTLDEVISFKNQIEYCNKKHVLANSFKRPKITLLKLADGISELNKFYQ